MTNRPLALITTVALCAVAGMMLAQPPAGFNSGGGRGASGIAGASGGRGRGFRQPDPIDFPEHAGWSEIFDGKSLANWDGDPNVWKADNGILTGEFNSPAGTRNGET